jgi:tRNA(adenine34) deaminase
MSLSDIDIHPMRLAIEASRAALEAGNMPFGATLVDPLSDSVLLVAANNQVTTGDCTGHAEMVLVRQAAEQLGRSALQGSTVYASGEPCAMCCGAMFWAGVKRVVYAASQADIALALGSPVLPIGSAQVFHGASPSVQVEGPLLAEAANEVLQAFASIKAP